MPAPIPKEKVLEDIRRVADKLDKVPTRSEYVEHGQYSEITPRAKCGSWTEAREEAGLEGGPTQNTWVDKGALKDEIRRVADKIGESPSQNQFNEHGEYSHWLVCQRYGSWNAALEECGLATRFDERLPDETVCKDIRSVAEKVGRVPSQADYQEHGKHGLTTVKRHFERWTAAVREAGFEPRDVGSPSGEENGYWRGGYEPYYGPNWAKQRRSARERDEYCCVACGMTDEEHKGEFGWELEVHHITAFRDCGGYLEANELENLITLCRTHHRKYEELPASECEKLKS